MYNVKTADDGNQIRPQPLIVRRIPGAGSLPSNRPASASHRYRRESCIAGLQIGEDDRKENYVLTHPLEKSQTNVTKLTLHLLGQSFEEAYDNTQWSQTNATNPPPVLRI